MALPTDQQTVSSLGGTTQPQHPNSSTSLNAAGNDMTLANRMNAGADQMRASREGSGGLSRPEAPQYDPFSRPGDGNGDSQKRQQEYEGLLRSAASQTGWGASKRAAAMTAAAQGLLAPGLEQMQAQGNAYQNQMRGYDAAMIGGYGGSVPSAGVVNPLLEPGLAQTFGNLSNPVQPGATAPSIPDPSAPATPAATGTPAPPTTPALPVAAPTSGTLEVASALPHRARSDGSSASASASALEMMEQQQIAHKEKQAQEAKEWELIAQESSNNFRNIGAKNSSIRRLDLSDLVGGGLP